MKTYFAYRLPHEFEVHYLKGDLVKRESLTEMMGRGIVICDFQAEQIYQLENIQEIGTEEWQYHYNNRKIESTSFEDYKESYDQVQEAIKSGKFDRADQNQNGQI